MLFCFVVCIVVLCLLLISVCVQACGTIRRVVRVWTAPLCLAHTALYAALVRLFIGLLILFSCVLPSQGGELIFPLPGYWRSVCVSVLLFCSCAVSLHLSVVCFVFFAVRTRSPGPSRVWSPPHAREHTTQMAL